MTAAWVVRKRPDRTGHSQQAPACANPLKTFAAAQPLASVPPQLLRGVDTSFHNRGPV